MRIADPWIVQESASAANNNKIRCSRAAEEIESGEQEMRDKLRETEGKRRTYTATFECQGSKVAYKGPPKSTVLLTDIRDDQGVLVADHLWFNFTAGFWDAFMVPGDRVQFDARSTQYVKGYFKEFQYIDYKLSHPTRISFLDKEEMAGPEISSQLNA
jgi:hypothetical protein